MKGMFLAVFVGVLIGGCATNEPQPPMKVLPESAKGYFNFNSGGVMHYLAIGTTDDDAQVQYCKGWNTLSGNYNWSKVSGYRFLKDGKETVFDGFTSNGLALIIAEPGTTYKTTAKLDSNRSISTSDGLVVVTEYGRRWESINAPIKITKEQFVQNCK